MVTRFGPDGRSLVAIGDPWSEGRRRPGEGHRLGLGQGAVIKDVATIPAQFVTSTPPGDWRRRAVG